MATEINTGFQIISRTELPFSETEGGRKLTKASFTRTFDGELKGGRNLECLMAYGKNGSAVYTGYAHLAGTLDSNNTSLVPRHEDSFVNGPAKLNVLSRGIPVPVILREFQKKGILNLHMQ